MIPLVDKAINEVIEYSGVGYFLTIEHSDFPIKNSISTSPNINGVLGGVDVGFIVIIENSQLTLECYTYIDEFLPKYRDMRLFRKET